MLSIAQKLAVNDYKYYSYKKSNISTFPGVKLPHSLVTTSPSNEKTNSATVGITYYFS